MESLKHVHSKVCIPLVYLSVLLQSRQTFDFRIFKLTILSFYVKICKENKFVCRTWTLNWFKSLSQENLIKNGDWCNTSLNLFFINEKLEWVASITGFRFQVQSNQASDSNQNINRVWYHYVVDSRKFYHSAKS